VYSSTAHCRIDRTSKNLDYALAHFLRVLTTETGGVPPQEKGISAACISGVLLSGCGLIHMESSGEGVCLAGWRRWGFLTASGRSLRFLEAQAVLLQ